MNQIATIVRTGEAILLFLASVRKFGNLDEFRLSLLSLPLIESAWIPFLSLLIPFLELLVAGLLIYPRTARSGAWLGVALFAGFAGMIGWSLMTGTQESCGCFPGMPIGQPGVELLIVDLIGVAASLFLVRHLSKRERASPAGRYEIFQDW